MRLPRSSLTLLAVAFLATGCRGGGDEIVIGVIGPSSGPYAAIGRETRNGATLAAEEINRRGGVDGRKIRLAFRDDSDYSRVVTQLRDLVTREGAVAVIGPENATAVRDENSPTARAGVPTLTIGGTSGPITGNPHLYRLSPSNRDQAAVLAEWIVATRSMTKVAVVSAADEWGKDGAQAITREIQKRGGAMTAAIEVDAGAIDVTPQAQALRASGAEVAVLWTRPDDAARIATAIRQIGWGAQLAGPENLFETEFRSLGGTATDHAVLAMPSIEAEEWFGARLRDWFLEYHERFTLLPIPEQRTLVADVPLVAIRAYDAVSVIADAVARADSRDPEKVSAALRVTKGFEGILNTYSFGSNKRESFTIDDLRPARFFNLALLYDVFPGADVERQIAFYKVQVSAYYVPDRYLESEEGRALVERVLEDVLTNPEEVEFFKEYQPPRPAPGPI